MQEHAVGYEELIALAAGELDPAACADVERRVARDSEAATTLAILRSSVETLRGDGGLFPPLDMLERVQALFQSDNTEARPSLLDALKQVIGELVYDSRPQLALAGVRGSATAYQVAFESEAADVDLEVEPAAGEQASGFRVRGQVSPHRDGPAEQVALAQPGTRSVLVSAAPDEHGVFEIETSGGRFDLLVRMPNELIVFADVVIE